MITFKTQYEKLVIAYINNRVEPMSACACFVGNLLNGSSSWVVFKDSLLHVIPENELKESSDDILLESNGTYTPREILQMEGLFMRTWRRYGKNEESLFKAFDVTLALLRQIHESKGEKIDDYIFRKRILSESKTLEYVG